MHVTIGQALTSHNPVPTSQTRARRHARSKRDPFCESILRFVNKFKTIPRAVKGYGRKSPRARQAQQAGFGEIPLMHRHISTVFFNHTWLFCTSHLGVAPVNGGVVNHLRLVFATKSPNPEQGVNDKLTQKIGMKSEQIFSIKRPSQYAYTIKPSSAIMRACRRTPCHRRKRNTRFQPHFGGVLA